MNNTCDSCKYSCGIVQEGPSYTEKWQADTRPEPRTTWEKIKWFWDPSKWRVIAPDDVETWLDEEMEDKINNKVFCMRFPKDVIVNKDHWCGEFATNKGGRVE